MGRAMTQRARDWKRFTEIYDLTEQRRIAANQGKRTLASRINDKKSWLKFQFLPHYFYGVPKWRLWLRSFSGPRTLPDFACVGAIKCGTSDLSTYLFQHPCILPPLSKEIMALNTERWRTYYPTVQEKARVEQEHGKALSGYFNPALHSLPHIDALRAAVPNAKVILMLRNPVDRAFSQYKWDLFLGGKRLARIPYYQSFADYVAFAIDLFPGMALPTRFGCELLQTGIYVKPVQIWMDRFGRENIYILRAEDFFQDVAAAVCGIHEFLGIPAIEPEIHSIVNQNPMKPPRFEAETRQALQEFYRPWNEKLYALIGRDMEWE